jgi:RNA recognition motif-containing protein
MKRHLSFVSLFLLYKHKNINQNNLLEYNKNRETKDKCLFIKNVPLDTTRNELLDLLKK